MHSFVEIGFIGHDAAGTIRGQLSELQTTDCTHLGGTMEC